MMHWYYLRNVLESWIIHVIMINSYLLSIIDLVHNYFYLQWQMNDDSHFLIKLNYYLINFAPV